jgi:hypothetical protein
MRKHISYLVLLASFAFLFATSTKQNPSTATWVTSRYKWWNPDNAKTEDGTYSTVTWHDTSTGTSKVGTLKLQGFGFGLTATDTVDRIAAELKMFWTKIGAAPSGAFFIDLIDTLNANNIGGTAAFPVENTLTWTTMGGGTNGSVANDMTRGIGGTYGAWNFTSMSWDYRVINHANFGLVLTVGRRFIPITGAGDSAKVSLDAAKLIVYYHTTGNVHQTTTTNAPATVEDLGDGIAWTNINNAKVEDGVFSTCLDLYTDGTSTAQATDFGFSIPSGSLVRGMKCEWKAKSTSAPQMAQNIQQFPFIGIKRFNSATAGDNTSTLTTTNTWYSVGDETDDWNGQLPSRDQVNSQYFGFTVIFVGGDEVDLCTISLDAMRMTVYFFADSTIAGGARSNLKRAVGYSGGTPQVETLINGTWR